jgi:Kef-type K+ transport system membrane component KefB
LSEGQVFLDLALGLVMFDLGRRIDLDWFERDRSLAAASFMEIVVSASMIFALLRYFGFTPLESAVGAAIGVSTSPAVLLEVARDTRAEGQVTERGLALCAVNTLIAVFAVTMLFADAHFEYHSRWSLVVLHPLYLFFGSILIGAAAALTAVVMGRLLGKRGQSQFALMVALLLISVGTAHMLKLSVVLALLTFGIMSRRLDKKNHLIEIDWGYAAQLFYVVLFVITGASLPLAALRTAGWLAFGYVVARAVGKWFGVLAIAPFSTLRARQSGWLGAALLPMSAVAIVLIHNVTDLFPEFDRLAEVMLGAVFYMELIGPVAAMIALRRTGEIQREEI